MTKKIDKNGLHEIDHKFNDVIETLSRSAPAMDGLQDLKDARNSLTEIIHELVSGRPLTK